MKVTVQCVCTFLIAVCGLQKLNAVFSTRPPNIVIILLDDVGYGDLGCYWNPTGQPSNTPFLDYLADNGLRFTDFHSAASVCSPSRGSLLTGRLCVRNGYPDRLPWNFEGGLALNETTFGETFKAAGYRTGMIGKWGLGMSPNHHPNSRGFDFYFGLPDSNSHGCTHDAGGTVSPNVCPRNWSAVPGYNGSQCYFCGTGTFITPAVSLFYNRIIVEQPANQTSLSLRYSEMAARFITEGSEPYLLYVALKHTHTPLFHMPVYEGKSQSNSVYGDTLLEMDDTVKRIVEAIQESGQQDNTLVWVVSDNGPDESQCQYGGSPGPYVGAWQRNEGGGGSASKGTVFEAGHRVPSIAYWPGTIKGGQVSDAITNTMDIYPTMAALANIPMPDNRIYDGVDISGLLLGKPFPRNRVLYHTKLRYTNNTPRCGIEAVRIKDYKAVFMTGGRDDCSGNFGIIQNHSPPLIFNVKEDPMESSPLDSDSTLFESVLAEVEQAMADVEKSLQIDRTPLREGEFNTCSNPCCNALNVACQCQ